MAFQNESYARALNGVLRWRQGCVGWANIAGG